MSDLKNIFQNLIENSHVISGSFDFIKNVFNELLVIFYNVIFFLVFILFLILCIGFFIYLPLKIMKEFFKNRKLIGKFLKFDFKKMVNETTNSK